MRMLFVAFLLAAVGCSHVVPGNDAARDAAIASLNSIDPKGEMRIVFSPQVGQKTQRTFRGLRPAANVEDVNHLRAQIPPLLRIEELTVSGNTAATFKGQVGPKADNVSDCGTHHTLNLVRQERGWVVAGGIIRVC